MRISTALIFVVLLNPLWAQTAKIVNKSNDSYTLVIESEDIKNFEIQHDNYVFENQEANIKIIALDQNGAKNETVSGNFNFLINSELAVAKFKKGESEIAIKNYKSENQITYQKSGIRRNFELRIVKGWMSILPPLIAIIFALITRQVLVSLFLGILSGTVILNGFNLRSFFMVIEKYGVNALLDRGHISVIVFSTIIGGMVAIISKNGGMAGVVEVLSKYARSARSSQLVTWFLGIAIFFDDYANTLVVGNTMKPVTDKFKVSREKLAYLVDSTAAPVAAIAFITTWIGAELGYIDDATKNLNISEGAYSIFINSLKYAFYPVFTIVFMFILIWFQKDFGPMKKAEDIAKLGNAQSQDVHLDESDEFEPADKSKIRWFNAFIPVAVLIITVLTGLVITGKNSTSAEALEGLGFFRKLGVIIGNSDSYIALLWASSLAISVAIILTISQKIMTLNDTIESAIVGFKTMTTAMIILISAWALATVTEDLKTADFIAHIFTGNVSHYILPGITFVLAAAVAFSTGSSWGTMAILYPLILPTTWSVCKAAGLNPNDAMEIMYHVTSVVLAGAVLGDHCSPISDTTILSSLASGCNHIEHVRTQLPYALTVGVISLFASLVLITIGLPWYLVYAIGIGMVYLVIKFFGK